MTLLPNFNNYKRRGSYIGERNNPQCKHPNALIETTVESPHFIEYQRIAKRDSKYHLKGSIYTIQVKEYEPAPWYLDDDGMPSIAKVWKAASDYPTVSYCFIAYNPFQMRNALIVDIDEEFENLIAAKSYIKRTIGYRYLPMPSYIIRNPKSKHIQFGWFINKLYDKEVFNHYIKVLNKFFKGDICFNGPSCKNPYYHGFESMILSENNVDYHVFDCLDKLPSIPSYSSYDIDSYQEGINLSKARTTRNKEQKENNKLSRNKYVFNHLRNEIWAYMRNHNKQTPNNEELFKMADKLNHEAAIETGKNELLPRNELMNTVKSVYYWCIGHYKETNDITGNENRTLAQQVKSINKLYNWIIVQKNKEGHTQREIAALTGLSQVYVGKLLKLNEYEIMAMSIQLKCYQDYLKDNDITTDIHHLNSIIDIISDNYLLIPSYPSYDIDSYQTDREETNYICETNGQDKNTNKLWKMPNFISTETTKACLMEEKKLSNGCEMEFSLKWRSA